MGIEQQCSLFPSSQVNVIYQQPDPDTPVSRHEQAAGEQLGGLVIVVEVILGVNTAFGHVQQADSRDQGIFPAG